MGDRPSVADFYLFVTLNWATKFEIDVPAPLSTLRGRLTTRPSVAKAMAHEGLS